MRKNNINLNAFNKFIIAVTVLNLLFADLQFAQEVRQLSVDTRKDAIRLFIDCGSCDMDFIRYEMPYLNFVREIREAQVYLLVTEETNASGGNRYTLFFTGYNEFTGMSDTLTYNSSPDDTFDITRQGLTRTIAMGMIRYVAKTPIRDEVRIRYEGIKQERPDQVEDRWNSWVFEFVSDWNIEREKRKEKLEFDNSISAYRITPEWKLEHKLSTEYNHNTFITLFSDNGNGLPDEKRTEAIRDIWNYRSLTVKSINDHWSVGIRTRIGTDNTKNLNRELRVYSAIEYNLFPYYESSKKQIRFLYSIGYIYHDYIDTTVYNVIEDRLVQQTFDVAMLIQQRWGSTNFSLNSSSYVPDFSKNMLRFEGDVRFRLLKGLDLRVRVRAALIHNQIELSKGEWTAEELYLNLRELETNYSWDIRTGVVYTFGSIYQNIVNPRFGN